MGDIVKSTRCNKRFLVVLIMLACVVQMIHFQKRAVAGPRTIQLPRQEYESDHVIPSEERGVIDFMDAHGGNAYLAETPPWIQEYAQWHARELAQCRAQGNYTRARFLVLSCFSGQQCGGTSDRLRPLPYLIQVANATRRVLLIHWSKRFPLEAFLVPAAVNWTVPDHPTFHASCVGTRTLERRSPLTELPDRVLCFRSQNPEPTDPALFATARHPDGTFRQLFHALFRPSPGLARHLRRLPLWRTLARGPYLAAHIRARYPRTRRGYKPTRLIITRLNTTDPAHMERVRAWAENAVDAVVKLYKTHHGATAPLPPVYVASDTPEAIDHLKRSRNETIYGVAESNKENLEFATAPHASAYFPTFADLLLLGNATCASHGLGGYGLFAARLANESCLVKHRNKIDLPENPENDLPENPENGQVDPGGKRRSKASKAFKITVGGELNGSGI